MIKRRFDRKFTVMSLNMCEALTLNVGDVAKIASEFPSTIEVFYKEQSDLLEKVVVARLKCTELLKASIEQKFGKVSSS